MSDALNSSLPAPGYKLEDNYGPAYLAYVVSLDALAVLFIVLRFLSRYLSDSTDSFPRFWWDDWMVLAIIPVLVAKSLLDWNMVRHGSGHHVWNITSENIETILKSFYWSIYVYELGLTIAKASALLFYSRIFQSCRNVTWLRLSIIALHVANITWLVGVFFFQGFICTPLAKFWRPWQSGKCLSFPQAWVGNTALNVVIDLLILVLPLPIVLGLQLSRVRKAALVLVFACGYSVAIMSMGRLVTIAVDPTLLSTYSGDSTYRIFPVMFWTGGELQIGVLSICFPAMTSLIRRLFSACKSRKERSSDEGSATRIGSKDSLVLEKVREHV